MTTKTLGRLALITTPLAMIGGYYIAKGKKLTFGYFLLQEVFLALAFGT